jgi:hypothetical protein
MAFSLFRESVEYRTSIHLKNRRVRFTTAAQPNAGFASCYGEGSFRGSKKTLPSGQRFYQSFVCLSFDHIPQRFQFCLAE